MRQRDLDLFVTRQFLNDTPTVLSLGGLVVRNHILWKKAGNTLRHGQLHAWSCSRSHKLKRQLKFNTWTSARTGLSTERPVAWSARMVAEASTSGCETVGVQKPRRPVPLPKSGSGKLHVLTHFPKDPNCEMRKGTNITRAWRIRTNNRNNAQKSLVT